MTTTWKQCTARKQARLFRRVLLEATENPLTIKAERKFVILALQTAAVPPNKSRQR